MGGLCYAWELCFQCLGVSENGSFFLGRWDGWGLMLMLTCKFLVKYIPRRGLNRRRGPMPLSACFSTTGIAATDLGKMTVWAKECDETCCRLGTDAH